MNQFTFRFKEPHPQKERNKKKKEEKIRFNNECQNYNCDVTHIFHKYSILTTRMLDWRQQYTTVIRSVKKTTIPIIYCINSTAVVML